MDVVVLLRALVQDCGLALFHSLDALKSLLRPRSLYNSILRITTTNHSRSQPAMSARKNIVITGGARGIGRVTARHLASLGHNIFLIDINEPELVYTATEHIPKFLVAERSAAASEARESAGADAPTRVPPVKGGLIGYKTCDLCDQAAIRSTIHYAATSFFPGGHIDVLVNNAGIARAQFRDGRAMDNNGPEIAEDWTAYLATNLTAPFLVSQACIPYMKVTETHDDDALYNNNKNNNGDDHNTDAVDGLQTNGGSSHAVSPPPNNKDAVIRPEAAHAARGFVPESVRRSLAKPELQSRCIINISSFRAKQSEPNCEGYAASKAGLLGLTQAMSISGAQWGIRCNAILPGFTFVDHECKMADETPEKMWWTKDIDGARHRHHPVGRIGYGEDIAHAIVWLMSAGFVTGQEIVIDGGINRVKHGSA